MNGLYYYTLFISFFGSFFSKKEQVKWSDNENRGRYLLFFYFGVIADPQNVIDGGVIERRKFNQNFGWDVPLTELVIAVDLLRTI